MRTIIEYKNGETRAYDDAIPSLQPEDRTICCVDSDSVCLTDDEPLSEIARVIFEND